MPIHKSYTEARADFAALWDRATEDRETVIVKRRGHPDLAMIAADELSSLQETAYLLRSPTNALRLLTALNRALSGAGHPETVDDLRAELGLDART